MQNHCYLTKKNGGVYMEAPYDPEFIADLKRLIPQQFRTWDNDLKHWYVAEKYAAQADRLARAYFENVIEC